MTRVRSIAAWLLAVLWLPVTLHCDLEAAEFLQSGCGHAEEASGCATKSDGCFDDTCDVVEEGTYRVDHDTILPELPTLAALIGTVDVLAAARSAPDDAPLPEWRGRHRDWLADWTFVRRAAALARAPDPRVA